MKYTAVEKILLSNAKQHSPEIESIGNRGISLWFFKNPISLSSSNYGSESEKRDELGHTGIAGSGIRGLACSCSKMSPKLDSNGPHVNQCGPACVLGTTCANSLRHRFESFQYRFLKREPKAHCFWRDLHTPAYRPFSEPAGCLSTNNWSSI